MVPIGKTYYFDLKESVRRLKCDGMARGDFFACLRLSSIYSDPPPRTQFFGKCPLLQKAGPF